MEQTRPPDAHPRDGDDQPDRSPRASVRPLPARRPLRQRLGAAAWNLFLLLLAIAVGMAAGELMVRWIRPQQLRHSQNLYTPDSALGYVQRPSLDATISTGERTVRIRSDRDGYRVGAEGRVEAATRVLLIGDSFFQAIEVAYEQALAGLLQTGLPARLQRPVAVRDAGVSGYNPNHYRIAAGRAFALESAQVMIVGLYTGNDIIGRRQQSFPRFGRDQLPRPRRPRAWTLREVNRAVLMPLMLRTLHVSHLAVLAWNATELPRTRIGLAEYGFPATFLASSATGPEWDTTAVLCAEVAAVGVRHGASVLFLVIPQYFQMSPALAAAYAEANGLDPSQVAVDQPSTLLAERLRARGLEVIDALEPMRTAQREGRSVYGRIDRHLGPDGHDVLYRLAAPWVEDQLGRHPPAPAGTR